jgi:ribosomal protein L12E/L44/L45/RPP1/RPP2
VTPEISAKIAEWRIKAALNQLTPDEMREAIRVLREGRVAASHASAGAKAKKSAAKAPVDSEALLGELGSI